MVAVCCLAIALITTAILASTRVGMQPAPKALADGVVPRQAAAPDAPARTPADSQPVAGALGSPTAITPPQPPATAARPAQPVPQIDPSRQVDIAEGSRRLERGLQRALANQAAAASGAPAADSSADAAAADGRATAGDNAKAAVAPTPLPTNPWTYDTKVGPKPRPTRGPG